MTLSVAEKERRLSRCCKTCGKRMNRLDARNAKYCSIKCVASSKMGTQRHDCRKPITCRICKKTGVRSHRQWWNECRKMCRACAEVTPKKWAESNEKNRRYKTCTQCGFVGYGAKEFPHPFNGCCVSCWRKATGRPLKIEVADQWDEWANKTGSKFLREHRKRDKLRGDKWAVWAKNKQVTMIHRAKRKPNRVVNKGKTGHTWDTCITNRMYKLSQRTKYRAMSDWDRKAKRWTQSLIYRRHQQRDSRFEILLHNSNIDVHCLVLPSLQTPQS